MLSRTHSVRASEITERWWVVDAQDLILGRLASKIAGVLLGKYRANYATHLEMGDRVVVVNAARVMTTGKKLTQKKYYRHSGYPGGLRTTTLAKLLVDHPERVIQKAVWGMLPQNKLGRHTLKRLFVYGGPEHPHAGQNPEPLMVGGKDG